MNEKKMVWPSSKSRTVINYSSDDRVVGFLPFLHMYGMATVLFLALKAGLTISVMAGFEPKVFLETIQNHRVSWGHHGADYQEGIVQDNQERSTMRRTNTASFLSNCRHEIWWNLTKFTSDQYAYIWQWLYSSTHFKGVKKSLNEGLACSVANMAIGIPSLLGILWLKYPRF